MSNTSPNNTLRWWEWISLPALTTGLIYIMGWSYAYAYFAAFHVGLLAINIPGQYYIIYGFWVLQDHLWLVFVYLLSLWAWWRLQRWTQFDHVLAIALIPLLILALYMGAYQLAAYSAEQRVQQHIAEDFPAYPRVKVWLKDNKQQDPGLAEGCYRLLLQSGGQVLLLRPRAGVQQARLSVLQLGLGEIHAMRVLPQYRSCS